MLDSPLKLSDVLARAEAGDEHAREIVRSGGLVSVCRMAEGSSGETRSLPEEVRVAPPRVSRAGRREPRDVRASVVPPVVTFARQAWTDLRDEVYEYDGDEHGGALFGRRDGEAVIVERICGSSAWAERAATHFTIERDRYLAIEQNLPKGWHWLGDWHTHEEHTPRPSETDFRGWTAALRSEIGVYVGVVATVWSADEEWTQFEPRFTAWVVARDGACRPATITRGD